MSLLPALIIWNPLDWGSGKFFALIVMALLARFLIPQTPSWYLCLLREVLIVLPAVLFYFLVRGLVSVKVTEAFHNAEQIIAFERRLGVFWEPWLHRQILDSDLLVDLTNWIYIWGHWPLLALVMAWLIVFHGGRFPNYRNAMLISGVIGMVIFAVYPVAPPRFLPELGFVDTIVERSRSYRVLQPPALSDPYAAMPSLHFGWNLLIGIALVRESRHWFGRLFGLLMPVAMYSAIVLTANHYLLDGLAGGLIVMVALWVSFRLPHYGRPTLLGLARRPLDLDGARVEDQPPLLIAESYSEPHREPERGRAASETGTVTRGRN